MVVAVLFEVVPLVPYPVPLIKSSQEKVAFISLTGVNTKSGWLVLAQVLLPGEVMPMLVIVA